MGTITNKPPTEADDSYQWWSDFLTARLAALKAMDRLGKSIPDMVDTLNLGGEGHAIRLLTHPLNQD